MLYKIVNDDYFASRAWLSDEGTHQLFSASHDKTVKIWNLDEMAYVETL